MDSPKKPELPKKPESPAKQINTSGRSSEVRSRLGWEIYCTECGYRNGTTNYEGARKSALDRLKRSNKACPECGASAWDSKEIFD